MEGGVVGKVLPWDNLKGKKIKWGKYHRGGKSNPLGFLNPRKKRTSFQPINGTPTSPVSKKKKGAGKKGNRPSPRITKRGWQIKKFLASKRKGFNPKKGV